MKIYWSLLVFGIFCSHAAIAVEPAKVALPPKERLHLFLLAGQSNMAGRGMVAELAEPDRAADPRVLALGRDGEWRVATDPIHWDKSAAGVGVGKFFGRLVADASPGVVVGLIPSACGGSPISVWEPGIYFDQTKSTPWDDAIARARRAMKDGTLKGILWHQGEGDSNPKNAPLYAGRLEELITRFRTELNAPELPFIIGQLGIFPERPWSVRRAEVDQAQREVAAKMSHVYFVTAEELTSKDNLHFDTASLKILAGRYAEAYLNPAGQE